MQEEKFYQVFRTWVCTDTMSESIHGAIKEFLHTLPSKQIHIERVVVDYPIMQFPPESECKRQLRVNIRYAHGNEPIDGQALFTQIAAGIRSHPRMTPE